MAITEKHRHQLHKALEEILGAEEAATLMDHLPPTGWADVATRRDLDHLETTLRSEIQLVRAEVQTMRSDFRADLNAGLNRVILAMVAAYASLTGLLLAGIKFT